MGLTYTILGGAFQIAAIVFAVLAYNADKAIDKITPPSATTYNINGDSIKRDKKTNNKQESDHKKEKPQEVKYEENPNVNKTPNINNGIINSGVNNGTQTVNNVYKGNEPRQLNNQDIADIKLNIPKNYKLDFEYFDNSDESVNYAQQIANELIKMGYHINSAKGYGGLVIGGKPHKENERFIYYLNDVEKTVKIDIREQK